MALEPKDLHELGDLGVVARRAHAVTPGDAFLLDFSTPALALDFVFCGFPMLEGAETFVAAAAVAETVRVAYVVA